MPRPRGEDMRKLDAAIAEMGDIGYDGWVAKRQYIKGHIGEAELEHRLERSMGIGENHR